VLPFERGVRLLHGKLHRARRRLSRRDRMWQRLPALWRGLGDRMRGWRVRPLVQLGNGATQCRSNGTSFTEFVVPGSP
jgi:hypothetical protein